MENVLFEGLRKHLRFQGKDKVYSIEQLIDLTFEQLDEMAIAVYNENKAATEISFLKPKKKNTDNEIRFEILKGLIDYKVSTKQKAEAELKEKMKRLDELQKVKMVKDMKTLEDLQKLSIEDLDKRIAELEK
jgi:hypothetical protein